MPKFPAPAELAASAPDIRTLDAGDRLARIYFRGGPHPTAWSEFRHWGPTSSRFDHHLEGPGDEPCAGARGILYAAGRDSRNALALCAAEVFQETRTIDRRRRAPAFAIFELLRPISLVDLTGHWPLRAGASLAISTGPRSRSRRWSRAIFEACPAADGLWYLSAMEGGAPAVALYERASNALPGRPLFNRPFADPALGDALAEVAALTGYDIV